MLANIQVPHRSQLTLQRYGDPSIGQATACQAHWRYGSMDITAAHSLVRSLACPSASVGATAARSPLDLFQQSTTARRRAPQPLPSASPDPKRHGWRHGSTLAVTLLNTPALAHVLHPSRLVNLSERASEPVSRAPVPGIHAPRRPCSSVRCGLVWVHQGAIRHCRGPSLSLTRQLGRRTSQQGVYCGSVRGGEGQRRGQGQRGGAGVRTPAAPRLGFPRVR